jgi:hypothetical protein
MSIPINNTDYLPFQPGDWVRVVKKPKSATAVAKGEIIQADQVSPNLRMIRFLDPEMGWQHLGFDEVEAAPSARESVVTGTTRLSVRERQRYDTPHLEKALAEIKEILSRLQIWEQKALIAKLLSSRTDTVDNEVASTFNGTPKIVWKSPGGRDAKYPWFEYGKLRAYIGGGDRHSDFAWARVQRVTRWILEDIPPAEIVRRIKAKEFDHRC